MKKLIIRIIVAALAVATLSCLASCSQWKTPYEKHDKEGYNVSVRFDAGDGTFSNSPDKVYVVDLFRMEDFAKNPDGNHLIPLLAPDDSSRGTITYKVSRTGYFLAGWYSHRELRFGENGEMLDDFGNVTADPEAQGYVYSGKWDFENGLLEVDPDTNPSADKETLTLYAAWVPYYKFEAYVEGESEPYETVADLSLTIPKWENGRMNMKGANLPERAGYTFDGAYSDPECTQPITSEIFGAVDYETGTSLTPYVKIYTKWREGTWYKIETPEQFMANISSDGNYELFCDIDYTGRTWPGAFTRTGFSGTIIGNGHKITGISVNQTNNKDMKGGIFSTISGAAKISDLTFENITYNIMSGSLMNGVAFGALTSSIEDGAQITNVAVSGTLNIHSTAAINQNTFIGLVTSSGNHPSVTAEIQCFVASDEVSTPAADIDGLLEDDGTINMDVLTEYLSNS